MKIAKLIAVMVVVMGVLKSCATYTSRVQGKSPESVKDAFKVTTEKYVQRNGKSLSGDLFLPSSNDQLRPLVILIHGGGWSGGSRLQMTEVAERMARSGIAVFNISYRKAPRHAWPAQQEDVEAALNYVVINAQIWNIDPTKIGAMGFSAGAHLALTLAYHPHKSRAKGVKLAAVVGGGSPVDLTVWPDSKLCKNLIGISFQEDQKAWRMASPINYVSTDSPPTFLYHGRFDWMVNIEQSKRLVAKLLEHNVDVKFKQLYFGHVTSFLFDEPEVIDAIAFFKDHFDRAPGKMSILQVDR